MDPYAVLGIGPDASAKDVAVAYRRLAKRFHPDRAGERGARRMAEINAAYDQLRDVHAPAEPVVARARAATRASWLPDEIRERLGPELLRVLAEGEPVELVVGASTWASPHTLLAVSDRRLLWLLDDAVNGRVQTLRFGAIEKAEHSLRRPRRRVATLRVRARNGRRFAFGDLRPATAADLSRRIAAATG